MKHIKLFENFDSDGVIEIYNGFTLSGPIQNLEVAKELASEMEGEMKQTYDEYMNFNEESESAAMDARDDVFFDDYEEKFIDLGYKLQGMD